MKPCENKCEKNKSMRSDPDSKIFFVIIVLIICVCTWSLLFQLSNSDPQIARKYYLASRQLQQIKKAVITFYCENRRFPGTLDELVPETMPHLPTDPWGNKYIITSLAWRWKGSGVDILSMGGDGKLGGKAWKMDVILRIDLENISCGQDHNNSAISTVPTTPWNLS